MSCCLTAPSHYPNQCWLIISKALLHSPKMEQFHSDCKATVMYNEFEKYNFKITATFRRSPWVNSYIRYYSEHGGRVGGLLQGLLSVPVWSWGARHTRGRWLFHSRVRLWQSVDVSHKFSVPHMTHRLFHSKQSSSTVTISGCKSYGQRITQNMHTGMRAKLHRPPGLLLYIVCTVLVDSCAISQSNLQGCLTNMWAIMWLPLCQWSYPARYG